MTAPTSHWLRLATTLALALCCAAPLGGCVGASQVSETSNEPGDKSPNAGQQQQQGIGNVTLAYAGGAGVLSGFGLLAWMLFSNAREKRERDENREERDAELKRLKIVIDAINHYSQPISQGDHCD